MHASYAASLASQNTCSSRCAWSEEIQSPGSFIWFKIPSWRYISSHVVSTSNGTDSSQSRPRSHKRGNIIFARIVTGPTKPSGSKIWEMVHRMERLEIRSLLVSIFARYSNESEVARHRVLMNQTTRNLVVVLVRLILCKIGIVDLWHVPKIYVFAYVREIFFLENGIFLESLL